MRKGKKTSLHTYTIVDINDGNVSPLPALIISIPLSRKKIVKTKQVTAIDTEEALFASPERIS